MKITWWYYVVPYHIFYTTELKQTTAKLTVKSTLATVLTDLADHTHTHHLLLISLAFLAWWFGWLLILDRLDNNINPSEEQRGEHPPRGRFFFCRVCITFCDTVKPKGQTPSTKLEEDKKKSSSLQSLTLSFHHSSSPSKVSLTLASLKYFSLPFLSYRCSDAIIWLEWWKHAFLHTHSLTGLQRGRFCTWWYYRLLNSIDCLRNTNIQEMYLSFLLSLD